MSRQPESDAAIARLEAALDDPEFRTPDPELAADLALKRELAALDGPRLPDAVHHRTRRTIDLRRRAPWAVALAAGLAGIVVTTHLLLTPTPAETPSSADARELQQALEIVGRTGRRAMAATGEGIAPHVESPDWLLHRVPLLISPPAEADRSNDHEPS